MPLGIKLLDILIHTSVKLVTPRYDADSKSERYFNPHEREARDLEIAAGGNLLQHFNPHEREARDAWTYHR